MLGRQLTPRLLSLNHAASRFPRPNLVRCQSGASAGGQSALDGEYPRIRNTAAIMAQRNSRGGASPRQPPGAPGSDPTAGGMDQQRLQGGGLRLSRRFKAGDRYDPKDLDESKFAEFRDRQRKIRVDAFAVLGIDPLNEYKSVTLFSPFVSEMGRIRPRSDTGLSAKTQRRLGKAIRRARAMGLMSSLGKPNLLTSDALAAQEDDLSEVLSRPIFKTGN